jgi:hypothetical protein
MDRPDRSFQSPERPITAHPHPTANRKDIYPIVAETPFSSTLLAAQLMLSSTFLIEIVYPRTTI